MTYPFALFYSVEGGRVIVFRICTRSGNINGSLELSCQPTSAPLSDRKIRNEFAASKRNEIWSLGGFVWRGRRYRLDVAGRFGWQARYLKEVDAAENTVRFWQEVYDDTGKLVEIHEEFPVDKGHQKM